MRRPLAALRPGLIVALAALLPGCVTGPGEAGDRLIDLRTTEAMKLRILAEEASADAARAKRQALDEAFRSAYAKGTDDAGRINAELALQLVAARDAKRRAIAAEESERLRQAGGLHRNIERAVTALVEEWRRQGRVRAATWAEFREIIEAGADLYAAHKRREAEREAAEAAAAESEEE